MSWLGSGTITKKEDGTFESTVTASPYGSTEAAKEKAGRQITEAKQAALRIAELNLVEGQTINVSINGHAHSDGDAPDAISISVNGPWPK